MLNTTCLRNPPYHFGIWQMWDLTNVKLVFFWHSCNGHCEPGCWDWSEWIARVWSFCLGPPMPYSLHHLLWTCPNDFLPRTLYRTEHSRRTLGGQCMLRITSSNVISGSHYLWAMSKKKEHASSRHLLCFLNVLQRDLSKWSQSIPEWSEMTFLGMSFSWMQTSLWLPAVAPYCWEPLWFREQKSNYHFLLKVFICQENLQ